jgi:hypothetical protein
MAFMISRETENVQTSQEVIEAFRALTADGEKAYITSAELYAVSGFSIVIYYPGAWFKLMAYRDIS